MEHTVLVVEDEKGIREAIGIYMKNQGYHVILAKNGKEGLEKIHENDVHLAIVDIMMPVMDGITIFSPKAGGKSTAFSVHFGMVPQTLPLQLTQPRHPYGTQELLLSAATFLS